MTKNKPTIAQLKRLPYYVRESRIGLGDEVRMTVIEDQIWCWCPWDSDADVVAAFALTIYGLQKSALTGEFIEVLP